MTPAVIDATKPGPKFEVGDPESGSEAAQGSSSTCEGRAERGSEGSAEAEAMSVPAVITSIANVESREQALKDWLKLESFQYWSREKLSLKRKRPRRR